MLSNLHLIKVRVVFPTRRRPFFPPFSFPRPQSSFKGLTMRAKCPFLSRLVLPALRRVLKAPSVVRPSVRPIVPLFHVPFHSLALLPQTSPTLLREPFFLRHSFYAPPYFSILVSSGANESCGEMHLKYWICTKLLAVCPSYCGLQRHGTAENGRSWCAYVCRNRYYRAV